MQFYLLKKTHVTLLCRRAGHDGRLFLDLLVFVMFGHSLLRFAQIDVAFARPGSHLVLHRPVHRLGDDLFQLLRLGEFGLFCLNWGAYGWNDTLNSVKEHLIRTLTRASGERLSLLLLFYVFRQAALGFHLALSHVSLFYS